MRRGAVGSSTERAPAWGILAACALSACRSVGSPPVPPPYAGGPAGPPSEIGVESTPLAAVASTVTPPRDAEVAPAPELAPPKGARVVVEVERPYKLGQPPVQPDRASYQADLLDRRRWNTGGLGPLDGVPPDEGHPTPRVVIDVLEVKGPHDRAKVQGLLRRNHWIRVIGCYRLGAYKNQALRGDTRVTFTIGKTGGVRAPRVRSSTLGDEAVAACLAEELGRLSLPSAPRSSTVTVEIHVAPGDEPMPPPEGQLVPGEGQIDLKEVRRAVRLASPSFEVCYKRALLYRPELWGRLVLRLHVTETGEVDEAFETESRFPEGPTLRCILGRARELHLPRPSRGDLRLVVPLRLWSDGAPNPPPP